MTREKPCVRLDLEHRAHHALAVLATRLGDFRDAVEHQHGGKRKLGAPREHFATAAGQQVFVFEARPARFHVVQVPLGSAVFGVAMC
jgi:hypothetical protein